MIARAIQHERNRAGVSLSALANRAGIAKSTLSQLEAGQGNPSVETLWAIATALDIPLSFLFESPISEVTIIRAEEGAELSSEAAEFSASLLSSSPPSRRRDLYRTKLVKGSIRESKPHSQGTIEHAFVASGIVQLGPKGSTEKIKAGDYFSYPADVEHSYESLSTKSLLLLVMDSPV